MKRTQTQIAYAHQLAARLKLALDASRLSQTELARQMGITRAAVNQWVRTGQIQASNLMKFAEITGCDISWLMSGVNARSAESQWMDVIERLPEHDRERVLDYIDVLRAAASAQSSASGDEDT